jgi:hypothetical protein
LKESESCHSTFTNIFISFLKNAYSGIVENLKGCKKLAIIWSWRKGANNEQHNNRMLHQNSIKWNEISINLNLEALTPSSLPKFQMTYMAPNDHFLASLLKQTITRILPATNTTSQLLSCNPRMHRLSHKTDL